MQLHTSSPSANVNKDTLMVDVRDLFLLLNKRETNYFYIREELYILLNLLEYSFKNDLNV